MTPTQSSGGDEQDSVQSDPKRVPEGRREELLCLGTGAAAFLLTIPQLLSWFIDWSVADVLGKVYFVYLLIIPVLGIAAIVTGNNAVQLKMKTSPTAITGIMMGWISVAFATFFWVILFVVYMSQ